ncbi:3-carboxy-cis,cis-mucoante lactonizing enzyme [Stereum hirsutum FP-91666 SS1]|uniref:3-carboxy-cis,cis-mucoante lactonizing enzyme n=1 Tax=Stereum hirsutum (strain FP-91666) TaxID=721885 RepID=R7RVQ1_STEHR|nr:3-carboxy-cis,cis-mucoante lactonizing enzyme [Stereum hirsutum FP-91666 SS1]EIM79226.1 3-carboxy-cis,cis-mucoante lactonizing enzyme [Stereum hirsutum FP-91666 SS1]
MLSSVAAFSFLMFPLVILAEKHHLLVSTFSVDSIYSVEFDDESLTMSLIANNSAAAAGWITTNSARTFIYAAAWTSPGQVAAYTLNNNYTISLLDSIEGCDASGNPLYVSLLEEQNMILSAESTCSLVYGVDPTNGSFTSQIQVVDYNSSSFVHGIDPTPNGKFVFAADIDQDAVWGFSVDGNGTLVLGEITTAPSSSDGPRHVAFHPNSTYLYVLEQNGCNVDIYSIDNSTGALTYTNQTVATVPSANCTGYWADEVRLSADASILYASTRGRESTTDGFVQGYALSSDGGSFIIPSSDLTTSTTLFSYQTTTSGNSANAVNPAPSTIDVGGKYFVALTDSEIGFLAMLEYYPGNGSMVEVARLSLDDGGCCAASVWLD